MVHQVAQPTVKIIVFVMVREITFAFALHLRN